MIHMQVSNRRWNLQPGGSGGQRDGTPHSAGRWLRTSRAALRQQQQQQQQRQRRQPPPLQLQQLPYLAETSTRGESTVDAVRPLSDNENVNNEVNNTDAREVNAGGVTAYLVGDDAAAGEFGDETVIEGIKVETTTQSDNAAQATFKTVLSPRLVASCVLVLVVVVAVIVAVVTILPQDSVAPTTIPKTNNGTSTAVEEEAFPFEYTQAVQNITSPSDLYLPGSPQNRAMKWILRHNHARSPSDSRFLQRYILGVLTFAAKLDETLRASFHFLEESFDECDWRGIRCNNRARFVTRIDFSVLHLVRVRASGTIPSELGYLPELAQFLCGDMGLRGTIPPELAFASKLKLLSLPGNQLQAPFPITFENHSSLQTLSLSRNRGFGGTIPQHFSTIKTLTQLGAHGCNFTGTIPSVFGLLDSLRALLLEENALTGTLPSELGRLRQLERFTISRNQLSGRVPEEVVVMLPQVQSAWFHKNRFTGQIANSIPVLSEENEFARRKEIYFHGNLFSGTIPSTLANLDPIRNLTLHDNNFTGTMPSAMCEIVDGNDGKISKVNLTADCRSHNGDVKVVCACCEACF